MRIFIVFMLACMTATSLRAAATDYSASDSITVERIIAKARALAPKANKVVFIGKQLLGVPYVAHTLEKGKEHLVVNTRELDCTTFVENVLAIYLCVKNGKPHFADFCNYLRLVRYDKGVVSYPTRLHYFTSWIESNTAKGFVKETASPNPPFSAVQTIDVGYMTANPDKYKALSGNPRMVDSIARTERAINGRKYRFIPRREVMAGRSLRAGVRNGDIIALTTSKKGLDTSHVGIAVWKDGNLHLMNASSIHHKVVVEPMTLWNYMKRHPSQTGIRIVRIL